MKYKILVIIVTYNWEKWVNNVSNWINKSTIKLDTIIIDNWSTDKTLQLYKNKLKNIVKIVKNEKNLWFWAANNIWFKYAIKNSYDFVYLLNQDARFFENTIENLINISNKIPNIWIISPFQCWKWLGKIDKNFQENVCGYESNSNIFSDIYFWHTKKFYEISNVMAAHWLIPINIIKKVWWFSPTFFHYWEDDNYIDRVKYFWYKVYITPYINAIHDRYNRKETKDKKILLLYTQYLNLLSSPIKKRNRIFKWISNNLYYAIIYKSFKPITNIFRILINYPQIKKNRNTSINWKCPFLKSNNQK